MDKDSIREPINQYLDYLNSFPSPFSVKYWDVKAGCYKRAKVKYGNYIKEHNRAAFDIGFNKWVSEYLDKQKK